MPSSEPAALGTEAARAAARKYDLDLLDRTTGYYDAVHRSNGRKVQVKSASHERADGPGVFRVWRSHLQRLADVGGSVVLVVVSRDAPARPVLRVTKESPAHLLDVGTFRAARQRDMRGKYEARIPWPDLVDLS